MARHWAAPWLHSSDAHPLDHCTTNKHAAAAQRRLLLMRNPCNSCVTPASHARLLAASHARLLLMRNPAPLHHTPGSLRIPWTTATPNTHKSTRQQNDCIPDHTQHKPLTLDHTPLTPQPQKNTHHSTSTTHTTQPCCTPDCTRADSREIVQTSETGKIAG